MACLLLSSLERLCGGQSISKCDIKEGVDGPVKIGDFEFTG